MAGQAKTPAAAEASTFARGYGGQDGGQAKNKRIIFLTGFTGSTGFQYG